MAGRQNDPGFSGGADQQANVTQIARVTASGALHMRIALNMKLIAAQMYAQEPDEAAQPDSPGCFWRPDTASVPVLCERP